MALTKAHIRMLADFGVSVKDFGAVGDGTTDDTAAIQAAVDTNEALVYFPKGTYRTSSAIVLNSSQKIVGFGATVTAANGSFHNCFELTGKEKITISDIRIAAADGESAFDRAVAITDCYDIIVENCIIENIGNQASGSGEKGWGVQVTTATSAMPVYGVNGNFNITVKGNRISNIKGYGSNRGDAVYLRGVDKALVTNNSLDNCRRMTIAVTDYATNIRIADNNISDCYLAGIDIEPNTAPTGTGEIIISNNIIRNYGIKPAGLTGSQYNGIDLRGDITDRVVIDGNIIVNENSQGNECISMQNNPEYVEVTNNVLDCGGYSEIAMQTYAGSKAEYLVVANNIVKDFTDIGFDLGSHVSIVITGNMFKTSTAIDNGIYSSGGQKIVVANNVFEFADCSNCIYLQRVNQSLVNNNNISLDSGTGILIRDSSGSTSNSVVVGNFLTKNGATANDAIQITALTGATVNYIAGGNFSLNFANALVDTLATRVTGTFV